MPGPALSCLLTTWDHSHIYYHKRHLSFQLVEGENVVEMKTGKLRIMI